MKGWSHLSLIEHWQRSLKSHHRTEKMCEVALIEWGGRVKVSKLHLWVFIPAPPILLRTRETVMGNWKISDTSLCTKRRCMSFSKTGLGYLEVCVRIQGKYIWENRRLVNVEYISHTNGIIFSLQDHDSSRRSRQAQEWDHGGPKSG